VLKNLGRLHGRWARNRYMKYILGWLRGARLREVGMRKFLSAKFIAHGADSLFFLSELKRGLQARR
jgi:hypothetical protein